MWVPSSCGLQTERKGESRCSCLSASWRGAMRPISSLAFKAKTALSIMPLQPWWTVPSSCNPKYVLPLACFYHNKKNVNAIIILKNESTASLTVLNKNLGSVFGRNIGRLDSPWLQFYLEIVLRSFVPLCPCVPKFPPGPPNISSSMLKPKWYSLAWADEKWVLVCVLSEAPAARA